MKLLLSLFATLLFLSIPDSTKAQALLNGYAIDTIGASDTIYVYHNGTDELFTGRTSKFTTAGDFEWYAASDSLSGSTNATIKLQWSLYGNLWRTDTTCVLNGTANQYFRVVRNNTTGVYWRTQTISPSGTQATKLEQEWAWKP